MKRILVVSDIVGKTVAAMPDDLPLEGKIFVLNLASDIKCSMCEDTRGALVKTLDNFAYLHGFKVDDELAPFVILPRHEEPATTIPGRDPFCPYAQRRGGPS